MDSLKERWRRLPIVRKTRLFTMMLILVIIGTIVFSIWIALYTEYFIGPILTDISGCELTQECMLREEEAFRSLVRSKTEENEKAFNEAVSATRSSIEELSFDYGKIGSERYVRTWSIINAYSHYEKERDLILMTNMESEGAIERLYRVYDQIDYLKSYCQRLTQLTVEEGTNSYISRLPWLKSLPPIFLIFDVIVAIVIYIYSTSFARTLVIPIQKLSSMAKKVAENDFGGEDLIPQNDDELGDLVRTFNRMKHATEDNIRTLNLNHELSEKLHNEELERVEMEKELDVTKLNLLQSQVNPHFLFNTLNSVAGMAELENAGTTQRMIRALSNLFRYNLKNAAQVVSLRQELDVMHDYMYLQQMRFGERITYEVNENADPLGIRVPVFLLQPLVENAIVHGLRQKEDGGRIRIDISRNADDVAVIEIWDNGLGIDDDTMKNLTDGDEGSVSSQHSGIGIGNITRRVRKLYEGGDVRISSDEGKGTRVSVLIPQRDPGISEEVL